jgi:hypothetical protein
MMLAVAEGPVNSLSATTVAVFTYVPALEFGGAWVPVCTCIVTCAPGSRSPNLQISVTIGGGGVPKNVHVPGPVNAGLIVQLKKRPVIADGR